MIHGWRQSFAQPTLPFVLVQLSDWNAIGHTDPNIADVRAAQSDLLRYVPNVGMALAFDAGIAGNVHSPFKEEPGRRVALELSRLTTRTAASAPGPTMGYACFVDKQFQPNQTATELNQTTYSVRIQLATEMAPLQLLPTQSCRSLGCKPNHSKPLDNWSCRRCDASNCSVLSGMPTECHTPGSCAPYIFAVRITDRGGNGAWYDAGVEVEKGGTSLLLKVNATAQIPGLMCSGQQGYPGPDGRWTGKPGGGGADWYCQADSVRYAQGQSLCAVYDSGRGGRGDVPLAPFQTLPVMKACPTAKPPPPSLKADDAEMVATEVARSPRRTVMAWMGWHGRTDAQLDTIVDYFVANRDAITTASPATHSLGANASLIERPLARGAAHTPSSVFKSLHAGGVRVLPTIYNDANGYHASLLPLLRQLAASPDAFIQQAVDLAVSEGTDGWNVNFEIGAADWNSTAPTVPQASQLLIKFLDQFGKALHAKGKLLSVDMSTDTNPLCLSIGGRAPVLKRGCNYEWWPVHRLNTSCVDRFITMTTYQSFERFLVGTGAMVTGFWRRADGGNYAPTSPRRVGIGFGSTRPMNATELQARFSVVERLGIEEIDIWAVDQTKQVPDAWLPLLRAFVKGEPLPRVKLPLSLPQQPQGAASGSGGGLVPAASSQIGAGTGVGGARRTALAWMGSDGRNDLQLNASIAYFICNRDALTTASPTSHCLGMDGTLQERGLAKGATHTTRSVFQQLRAGGVRVMPTIYNPGTDCAGVNKFILPYFLKMAAAPDAFIKQVVDLAVEEDLDGWSVDFELGPADWNTKPGPTQNVTGAILARFVDRLAQALHAKGKVLSLAVGTCCSEWWDAKALNATALDRIADMSTYKSFPTFIVSIATALVEYASDKIGVGFSNPSGFGLGDIQARFDVMEGLGLKELEVYFVEGNRGLNASWLPSFREFVGTNFDIGDK